jgi:nucleoid DNA-binding protein
MNKQLIKDLSQELVDKFELDKKQANSFVEKMFSVLQDGLQDEKIVKIKGLGTFKVISVQSRKSIDVNTGEPILIDGRDKISFTPDSDMRDFVNRPFSQFETVAVNDGTDFSLIDKKFEEEEKEETSEDSVENKQEDSNVNQQEDSIVNRQKDSISIEDQQQEDSVEDKQEETPENQPEEVQNSNVQSLATEVPNEVVGAPLQENILSEAPSSKEEETPAHDGPAAEEDNSAQEAPSMEENTPTQEAPSIVETANSQEREEPKDEESTKQEVLAQEPNESEQELEGNTPKAESVEQETKDSQPEIQAFDLEKKVQTATANISRQFEDENHILQAANEELRNNFRHQYRMMKGVLSVFVIIVLLCLGGGYFLLNQLKKRDHRIEMLEILAYRNKNGINAQPGNDSTLNATSSTANQSSQKQTANEAQAKENAKVKDKMESQVASSKDASQPSTTTRSNLQEDGQRNAMKAAANTNNTKLKPSESAVSKQETDKDQTAYNQDVRIRTGAYRIVGISHTVKVRSGQTLSSISRANLGPGMECYVQAVNGGKTNFKAGETVKIPKLQIKKRK